MDTYLEVEVQDELCKRLFLSFVKRTPTKTLSVAEGSKVIKVIFYFIQLDNVNTIGGRSSLTFWWGHIIAREAHPSDY